MLVHQAARRVVGAFADEPRVRTERRRPSRDVRRLPARAGVRDRERIGAGGERLVQPNDHVEEEIAETDSSHS